MNARPSTAPKGQALKQVATNLFRSNKTGIYYAIFKRKRRQVKRSLKTTDRGLAGHRLDDLRHKIARLKSGDKKILPFAEYGGKGVLVGGLAKRWFDWVATGIEPSTQDRYLENIQQLSSVFRGMTMGRIGVDEVETWAKERRPSCSSGTFTKERDVLVRILQYGVDHGMLLDNPAERLSRPE